MCVCVCVCVFVCVCVTLDLCSSKGLSQSQTSLSKTECLGREAEGFWGQIIRRHHSRQSHSLCRSNERKKKRSRNTNISAEYHAVSPDSIPPFYYQGNYFLYFFIVNFQSRVLGRGCDEALFSEKKGFSVKRGEAIQWIRGLARISTGTAIQWRASGHSLNRRTLKTEKLLSSSPSRKSALKFQQKIMHGQISLRSFRELCIAPLGQITQIIS